MADQSTHGLTYGHVGQFLYNKTDSTWLARRAFGTEYALQPLAQPQWAVKPLGDGASHDTAPLLDDGLDNVKPGRRVNNELSSLSKRLPALTPTAGLSAPFAHLSEDVTAVTARHDATFGDLLAFGRVADHATKRTFSVAAFPARSSPTLLCLTQVQHQKQGWEQNKTVWIEVPRIAGEVALWNMAQPIRQLAFSTPPGDPDGLTPYLAVRTPVAVHVLRISLRKHALSVDTTQHSPNRFSIAPSHVLNLDSLGGVPPAHVIFNPHYEKQVATIDQSGTWRIWDMSRQATGHQGKPLEIATGATSDQSLDPNLQKGRVLDDGWGRIAWAGISTTIITVSRRAIGIYDISNKPIRLPSPDLAINNTPHWILDMHMSPVANDIVFILTSVQLVCLRILSVADSLSEDHEKPVTQTIFRTNHFMDPEDISLSLFTFLDGEDTVVLIKSSLSLIATTYRCSAIETSTIPFLSVSDPALLTLPENPSDSQASLPSMGLHVHPARYAEGYSGASGLGEAYRDSAVRFYMMTTLFSDMSIVEKLYSGRPDPDSSETTLPVDWHSRLTGGAARLQSRRFVVDDDTVEDSLRQVHASAQSLGIRHKSPSMAHNRKGWTVTYENSYNLIAKSERAGAQDFSDVLETVWNNLESQDEPRKGIQTLFDLCESHISVADLDEAAAQFRHLLLEKTERDKDREDNLSQAMPTSLAVASVLGLPDQMDNQYDPMAIYDNIINHWLAPLSQRVPGRVRLAKEQLARRVAAEVCLASCGLKSPDTETPQDDHQASDELAQTQPSTFLGSSQPQSSFPTPSPTATPSLTTATSLSSHPSTLASPEYIRLQKYATFNGTKPTPAPLPKSLSKKLAHWSLGGNPDEYNWLTLQRQQDKEAEEDDEGLTPKERARLKRRAERHLKKQRRETLKAATMDAASSQAPEILSASQPAAVMSQPRRAPPRIVAVGAASQGVPLLSSSQGVSQSQTQQLLPATQIEPGKFGGRAPPPKKKRKRERGF